MGTAGSVVRTVYVYNTGVAKILISLFLNPLNLKFVGMMCKIAVVYPQNALCGQCRLFLMLKPFVHTETTAS